MAVKGRVARLRSVAKEPVVTVRIVGDVIALIGSFVAGIIRATNAVVTVRDCARLAIKHRIARFRAVAEQTVVTQPVARNVVTRGGPFVARVVRAAYTVVTVRRRTVLTVQGSVTGFSAVAEEPVVAVGVVSDVVALVRTFVARVIGAADAIVAVGRGAGQTIATRNIACLGTVAKEPVVTLRIGRAAGRWWIEKPLHRGKGNRKRAIHGPIGRRRGAIVRTVEPAAAKELSDDLARGVDDR